MHINLVMQLSLESVTSYLLSMFPTLLIQETIAFEFYKIRI